MIELLSAEFRLGEKKEEDGRGRQLVQQVQGLMALGSWLGQRLTVVWGTRVG